MTGTALHPRGAGRFGCLVFLVGLVLLWGGGQGLYTALTNTSPTEMTLKDYEAQRPRAAWLKLKGCTGFLPAASYRKSADGVSEVFVPLYDASDDPNDEGVGARKAVVLLATKRPEALKLLKEIKDLKPEEQAKFLSEDQARFHLSGDFSGLVQFGIELSDSERKKLATLDQSLDPDFVILEEGNKPDLGFSALMFGVGLVIAVFTLRSLAKNDTPKKKGDAETPAAAPGDAQPPAPNPPG